MKAKQTGFTLVEIAIVLVIIGLLLGGVLKGQELVTNARVKSLANDLRSVPMIIYAYQDRFRATPGDDPNVVTNLGATATLATPAGTRGNGLINGAWSAGGTAESFLFWQHVRLANLATGTPVTAAAAYIPRNSMGGQIGVSSTSPITTLIGNTYYVCMNGVDGTLALRLDTNMDDGNGSTGTVQAIAGAGGAAAAGVATPLAGTSYIVCMGV